MVWVLKVSQFLIRLSFSSGVGVLRMRKGLSRIKIFVGSMDNKEGGFSSQEVREEYVFVLGCGKR